MYIPITKLNLESFVGCLLIKKYVEGIKRALFNLLNAND